MAETAEEQNDCEACHPHDETSSDAFVGDNRRRPTDPSVADQQAKEARDREASHQDGARGDREGFRQAQQLFLLRLTGGWNCWDDYGLHSCEFYIYKGRAEPSTSTCSEHVLIGAGRVAHKLL